MLNGRIKFLHVMARATRDSEGRLEYIGAVQDVTQRTLSDEALTKSRSELAHITRVMSLDPCERLQPEPGDAETAGCGHPARAEKPRCTVRFAPLTAPQRPQSPEYRGATPRSSISRPHRPQSLHQINMPTAVEFRYFYHGLLGVYAKTWRMRQCVRPPGLSRHC